MATLLRPFKWLLCQCWRLLNFVRRLVMGLLTLLLLIGIGIGIASIGSEEKKPAVEGVLVVNPTGQLVEQLSETPSSSRLLRNWLSDDTPPAETLVSDVVKAIDGARDDQRIKGILLNLDDLQPSSLGKLLTIADALDRFRQHGKTVIASGSYFRQHQYLLAAHASRILLDPAGAVILQGFGSYGLYYREAMDRFHITPYVFRVGTYKSFVEPFTRDDMSPEAREANSRWINQLWQHYVQSVSQARQLTADQVDPDTNLLLQRLQAAKGNAARYALDNKLVDALLTRPQRQQEVIKLAGASNNDVGFRYIGLGDYLDQLPDDNQPATLPQIARIVASGTINSGRQPAGTIGDDSLIQQLQKVETDPQIKALVLRLDSPGGSAFAAEQIRVAVDAIRAKGKPVVVSMGSLTASGGYWIATAADKLIAEPTTLTGSIGVFGMFATVDKALASLGIHSDGVATSQLNDTDPTRPLPEAVQKIIQMNIEDTYQRFLSLVAANRRLSPEAVDKVAQGRVWTGSDALAHGLVDALGDEQTAITAAAKLAKLDKYRITDVEPTLTPREKLLRQLFSAGSQLLSPAARGWLAQWTQLTQWLPGSSQWNDPQGQYLLSPLQAP